MLEQYLGFAKAAKLFGQLQSQTLQKFHPIDEEML